MYETELDILRLKILKREQTDRRRAHKAEELKSQRLTFVNDFNDGVAIAVDQLKQRMVDNSRSRAKSRGVPHSITVDDFCIPQYCPALNIPLFLTHGKYTDNSPSLDRIDPIKGYVPGNIQVISKRANTIKNDATADELMMIVEYINSV